MQFEQISRILGRYLLYFSYVLCVPLLIAAGYEFFIDEKAHPQTHSTLAFLFTFLICFFLAAILRYFGKGSKGPLHRKESILLVVLIWFITAVISALPFTFTKTLKNPIDAYFEVMSGLTTTGATIISPKAYDPITHQEVELSLVSPTRPEITYKYYGTVEPVIDSITGEVLHTGVEAVGKALLFWRSFLQWLGGMGVVVLFIAVLPALSIGGKFLFETEMPGPNKEGMTPRIKETASLLWKIYLGLTALQIVLLVLTNSHMPLFDAINLSFTTISTGGFSIRNDGINAYHSSSTESIIAIFMLLGSINFTLYFYCMRGKVYRIYEPEFFLYLFTLIFGSLLMTWTLWDTPKILFNGTDGVFSLKEALCYGTFQAISCQSSTGFSLGNFSLWPFSSTLLLLLLIYVGGMSGSTAGGIKIARHLILYKQIVHKIESIFRPSAVRCVKVGEKEISDKTAITVFTFFCVLIFLVVIGTYVLVLDGTDPQSSFGIITCMTNNAGIIYSGSSIIESCAFLSNFSKILCILWMVLGRLEFFALLVLLVPAFWKNR